ncbi:sortase [Patescibacteria group bacterium]|nr:sortase [Patescibacteria group bacterium]MBU2158911.1 sortase [Patescibacteria group bacterium]
MALVTNTVQFIRAFGRVYAKKWSFLLAFLAVFFVSFSALASLDLIPETPAKLVDAPVTVPQAALVASVASLAPENPVRVEIPAIDLDVSIKNPESTDVKTLDAALLSGAVRYPTSAKLGEEGNVILFGHSSYLPVVNNKAFKAFNAIQNLKAEDRILVHSEGMTYVYAVREVASADAESAAIPLTKTGHTLTLATCDSFGKKTDRFVVVADLVESYPLGS